MGRKKTIDQSTLVKTLMVPTTHLDLLDRQVEEGQVVTDGNDRFGTLATHGGAQTTVELDDHQFVEHGLNLILGRGAQICVITHRTLRELLDFIPLHRRRGVVEEAQEEPPEALELALVAFTIILRAGEQQLVQLLAQLDLSVPFGQLLEGCRVRALALVAIILKEESIHQASQSKMRSPCTDKFLFGVGVHYRVRGTKAETLHGADGHPAWYLDRVGRLRVLCQG